MRMVKGGTIGGMIPFTAAVLAVVTAGPPAALSAGEVHLKNGTTIEGEPVPILGLTKERIRKARGPTKSYPILLVDTGLQRYFVPARQVENVNRKADLSRYEEFQLDQRQRARNDLVQSLGRPVEVTEFDKYGRRRVTLATPQGQVDVVQGITKITPRVIEVTGLTHVWEHGIAPTSLQPDVLDRLLRTATESEDPEDRMAIARFYLQAGMYSRAAAELDAVKQQFPELADRVDELESRLRELQARRLLTELQRRREAGQHRLAMKAVKVFPTENLSAAVLRDVREFKAEYDRARKRGDKALLLLGELGAQLEESQRAEAVAPLRSIIADRLDEESLPRLDAFLNLADDESLPPDEKLALAYSGWVLGSANAITDLDAAVRLWNARFLILEYLRTSDVENLDRLKREEVLDELTGIEGVGPQRVLQMIPHLPPLIRTDDIQPGVPQSVEVPGESPETTVRYSVLLPPEYSAHHPYPAIVALRPADRTIEDMLEWWGGTAAKPGPARQRGYIVIAPQYVGEKQTEYDYRADAHYAVVRSLRDARKRFNIDSDRVFLSGHGMGGDAAFDIGMTHPGLFAGVMPITGICGDICNWYWENCPELPWYIVGGELDRDSLARNATTISRMMRRGYDVIYAEYIGRGYESYYEEIHKLFDWMERHRRRKDPREFEVKVLRPRDNRFFWVEAHGLPRNVTQAPILSRDADTRIAPMLLNLKITPGNSVYILKSGARRHTIWLSPELIDFEKRVEVKFKGRSRFRDFIQPSIETILEDVRRRGDRQKIYSVRLDID